MSSHEERSLARFALDITGKSIRARTSKSGTESETLTMYEGQKPAGYRAVNDPDPRAFLVLQVHHVLAELDDNKIGWHTQVFHHVHVLNKPLRFFKGHSAAKSLYGTVLNRLATELSRDNSDMTVVSTYVKDWQRERRREYKRVHEQARRDANSKIAG